MTKLKQVGIDVEVNRMVEQHRRAFSESVSDILRRILPLVPLPRAGSSPGGGGEPEPLPRAASSLAGGGEPEARAGSSPAGGGEPEPLPRAASSPAAGSGGEPERAPGTRSRGQWTVEIQGRRIPAANLKSAYRTLLLALSERHPDFLPRFAEEKGRSRRFVARTPGGLYASSPHLAKRHAMPLVDGWYFDTNLSADQASRRLRIAARLCGLRYGADVRILENLREI